MRTILVLAGLMGVWWTVSLLSLVPPLYLPRPDEVMHSYRHDLFEDCGATVVRTICGFTLGIVTAYVIHFLSVVLDWVDALDPHFAASRAIPGIALMPLFILWFGFGETGRIVIVTLTAALYFLAPLQGVYQTLPREWTLLRDQIPLSRVGYYLTIVIPGTASYLLGAFRLTLAISFTIAIASDYMGAQTGIGKFIDTARVTYNVPGIFLALLVASLIGLVLDRFVMIVFGRVVHWSGKTIKA